MLHAMLWVSAQKQLFVSSWSIPIRILCCMLCCGWLQEIAFCSSRSIPIRILCCMLCSGYLQAIAVCFQPVNTHLNSMLHVVLQVFARNCCLFLAGQYPSEFYVACCVLGICKQLFVSSWPIPIRILCCMLCCGYSQTAVSLEPVNIGFQLVNTHPNSMLHVVLSVFASNSCLFLAGQYPSKFYVACCVLGICKTQLFVSSRSIPIRILCCMLCSGYLQEIAVCFQPVNTHLNSMLHVVLWVFARNSCLFLAGQYPSEFYVACCVAGICKKQLVVSSWSIPIRILCCMLCCGYLSGISVCFQPVKTHPNAMLHLVLWAFANSCLFLAGQYPSEFYVACCVVGICKKQLFVSNRSIPIRILCCMLCCGYLKTAVCFQPVNTHQEVLCCMLCCGYLQEIAVCLQPVNAHPNSMLHAVLWVFANSCLFLEGQYPSEVYVACCVLGICKQLFVSSWSIPIRILCGMSCCGYLQIAVCLQPANTHPNSMLHVVLRVFADSCLFLANQYPSEFYVAWCVVGICKQLFVSSRSIPIRMLDCMLCCGHLQIAVCFQLVNTHPNSMLHVVLWVFENSCLFLAGQYPSEFYVACCVAGICRQLFVSSQ